VGTAVPPGRSQGAGTARAGIESIAESEGLAVLGWREVPIVADLVGAMARACMPHFEQVFLAPVDGAGTNLDAMAFRVRKRAQNKYGVYFPSLSSKTMVYKGMLTTAQLEPFYPDLSDSRFKTRLGIVHSRFSTNTVPSWPLAQPFRTIAHNGEINTVKGNRNWMRARQSQLANPLLGDSPEELFPICTPGRVRFGLLRRGRRTADPLRPADHPLDHDDDPRGLGKPRHHGPRPPGVLPVPLHAHGALGRTGRRVLHRRPARRGGP
jgi:glutamate synthase (NADPH/NADH) large chain